MAVNFSHQRVSDVFSEALELGPENRAEFLAGIGYEDPELRAEVESLLASFEKNEDFIESPAGFVNLIFSQHQIHDRILGQYRIIREIGQGGMGAVYLAERADGEFDQEVAIKLNRQTIGDRELIRRFLDERQILAKLRHPNIANLIDGGMSRDGQPYLVMEFIDGIPITDFCRQHNLSLKERLKLFMKVCKAVAYAHRNLVVHRDIKPSNILVTNEREPKLLDFGLARLSDRNGSETVTQTTFRAFTPAYAAPEQLNDETITIGSDIYSLGVVLYEMLTDSRPFQTDRKSLEAIIREVSSMEPAAPSSVVKNRISAAENENSERAAGINPNLLKGDLDNIILTALRKEPERRYVSVGEFARDIENYLDGLPVRARPNTVFYRAEKFFYRNRMAVVAGFLILASLVGGLIISLRQTKIARDAQINAERESVKSKKITAFMEKIFNYANPLWYAEGRTKKGEAKLSEVLDELSVKIETEFPDDLDVQAELHHKYAEIYLSRKQNEKGLLHAERALELRRRVFGFKNAEVAKDLYYLAAANQRAGKIIVQTKLYEEALVIFREVDPENPNLPYLLENYGVGLQLDYGDLTGAENYLREAYEIFKRKEGDTQYNSIRVKFSLSFVVAQKGESNRAEEYFREAENDLMNLTNKDLREQIYEFRARFETVRGNDALAAKIIEDRLAAAKTDAEAETANLEPLKNVLKIIYENNHDDERLSRFLYSEIESEKRKTVPNALGIGQMQAELASALFRSGSAAEAKTLFAEALAVFRKVEASFGAGGTAELGKSLFYQKRYREALIFLQKAADFYRENVPPNQKSKELSELLDKTRANLKE